MDLIHKISNNPLGSLLNYSSLSNKKGIKTERKEKNAFKKKKISQVPKIYYENFYKNNLVNQSKSKISKSSLVKNDSFYDKQENMKFLLPQNIKKIVLAQSFLRKILTRKHFHLEMAKFYQGSGFLLHYNNLQRKFKMRMFVLFRNKIRKFSKNLNKLKHITYIKNQNTERNINLIVVRPEEISIHGIENSQILKTKKYEKLYNELLIQMEEMKKMCSLPSLKEGPFFLKKNREIEEEIKKIILKNNKIKASKKLISKREINFEFQISKKKNIKTKVKNLIIKNKNNDIDFLLFSKKEKNNENENKICQEKNIDIECGYKKFDLTKFTQVPLLQISFYKKIHKNLKNDNHLKFSLSKTKVNSLINQITFYSEFNISKELEEVKKEREYLRNLLKQREFEKKQKDIIEEKETSKLKKIKSSYIQKEKNFISENVENLNFKTNSKNKKYQIESNININYFECYKKKELQKIEEENIQYISKKKELSIQNFNIEIIFSKTKNIILYVKRENFEITSKKKIYEIQKNLYFQFDRIIKKKLQIFNNIGFEYKTPKKNLFVQNFIVEIKNNFKKIKSLKKYNNENLEFIMKKKVFKVENNITLQCYSFIKKVFKEEYNQKFEFISKKKKISFNFSKFTLQYNKIEKESLKIEKKINFNFNSKKREKYKIHNNINFEIFKFFKKQIFIKENNDHLEFILKKNIPLQKCNFSFPISSKKKILFIIDKNPNFEFIHKYKENKIQKKINFLITNTQRKQNLLPEFIQKIEYILKKKDLKIQKFFVEIKTNHKNNILQYVKNENIYLKKKETIKIQNFNTINFISLFKKTKQINLKQEMVNIIECIQKKKDFYIQKYSGEIINQKKIQKLLKNEKIDNFFIVAKKSEYIIQKNIIKINFFNKKKSLKTKNIENFEYKPKQKIFSILKTSYQILNCKNKKSFTINNVQIQIIQKKKDLQIQNNINNIDCFPIKKNKYIEKEIINKFEYIYKKPKFSIEKFENEIKIKTKKFILNEQIIQRLQIYSIKKNNLLTQQIHNFFFFSLKRQFEIYKYNFEIKKSLKAELLLYEQRKDNFFIFSKKNTLKIEKFNVIELKVNSKKNAKLLEEKKQNFEIISKKKELQIQNFKNIFHYLPSKKKYFKYKIYNFEFISVLKKNYSIQNFHNEFKKIPNKIISLKPQTKERFQIIHKKNLIIQNNINFLEFISKNKKLYLIQKNFNDFYILPKKNKFYIQNFTNEIKNVKKINKILSLTQERLYFFSKKKEFLIETNLNLINYFSKKKELIQENFESLFFIRKESKVHLKNYNNLVKPFKTIEINLSSNSLLHSDKINLFFNSKKNLKKNFSKSLANSLYQIFSKKFFLKINNLEFIKKNKILYSSFKKWKNQTFSSYPIEKKYQKPNKFQKDNRTKTQKKIKIYNKFNQNKYLKLLNAFIAHYNRDSYFKNEQLITKYNKIWKTKAFANKSKIFDKLKIEKKNNLNFIKKYFFFWKNLILFSKSFLSIIHDISRQKKISILTHLIKRILVRKYFLNFFVSLKSFKSKTTFKFLQLIKFKNTLEKQNYAASFIQFNFKKHREESKKLFRIQMLEQIFENRNQNQIKLYLFFRKWKFRITNTKIKIFNSKQYFKYLFLKYVLYKNFSFFLQFIAVYVKALKFNFFKEKLYKIFLKVPFLKIKLDYSFQKLILSKIKDEKKIFIRFNFNRWIKIYKSTQRKEYLVFKFSKIITKRYKKIFFLSFKLYFFKFLIITYLFKVKNLNFSQTTR